MGPESSRACKRHYVNFHLRSAAIFALDPGGSRPTPQTGFHSAIRTRSQVSNELRCYAESAQIAFREADVRRERSEGVL